MKKVILFGTGRYGLEACDFLGRENILLFVDNNKMIQGSLINGIEVVSPDCLYKYYGKAIIVLAAREELAAQMKYQLLGDGIEQFIPYYFIKRYICRHEMDVYQFLSVCSTEAGMYKYMYLCENEQRLRYEEKSEFFMRNTDIRGVRKSIGALRKLQLRYADVAVEADKMAQKAGARLMLGGGTLIGAVRHGGFIPWDDDIDFLMMREDYNRFMEYYLNKDMLYISDANPNNEAQIYDEMYARMKDSTRDIELCFNGIFLTVYKKIEEGSPVILDIFPMDYYKEDTEYAQLVKYECEIESEVKSLVTVSGRYKYYNALQRRNPFISSTATSKIGYGTELIFDVKKGKDFFKTSDVFPLRKTAFENYNFYVPANSEKFLSTEYGDIYKWPSDAGETTHGRMAKYISYSENDKVIYIDCMSDVVRIMSVDNEMKADMYVVRKYLIDDINEYFRIVEELDKSDIEYYVYA